MKNTKGTVPIISTSKLCIELGFTVTAERVEEVSGLAPDVATGVGKYWFTYRVQEIKNAFAVSLLRTKQDDKKLNSGAGFESLAHAAIALLLHRPNLAPLADSLWSINHDDHLPGVGLLLDVLGLLNDRPSANMAMILGYWYGTPDGKILNGLAQQEILISENEVEQSFKDTVQAIALFPQKAELAALVSKNSGKIFSEISEADKKRLRDLLEEKQRRDKEKEIDLWP